MNYLTYSVNRFFDHQLYEVVLHGSCFQVTVTAASYIADHWVRQVFSRHFWQLLSGEAVVGVAIQWNRYGDQGNGPPSTLQLCVDEYCLVFQLSRAEQVPLILRLMVALDQVTYVGILNPNDRQLLLSSRHALELPVDLLDIVWFLPPHIANGTLETIVFACLGYTAVSWPFHIIFSDWNADTLSDEQAVTASARARCAFLIARNLQLWRWP